MEVYNLANCKISNLDGSGEYIFVANPELPFKEYTSKKENEKSYRLNDGTKKKFKGVVKRRFQLNFFNITVTQKDIFTAFWEAGNYAKFYLKSTDVDYFEVDITKCEFTKDVNDVTYSGKLYFEEV